jgi:mono/diheme cytochrome c family protein
MKVQHWEGEMRTRRREGYSASNQPPLFHQRKAKSAMSRTALSWMGVVLVGACYLQAAQQEPASAAPPASPQRALLNRYCIVCHNEKLRTAELLLDKAEVENPAASPETWEKVVRKLRARAMPPVGMPRPDSAGYDSLATYLETALDRAVAAKPNPGRAAPHRLNRAEYANAIRDLLAVEVDSASLLPPDDVDYGFDNIAEVLSVSPLLMERYMLAAGKVSRLAIGNSAIRPGAEVYRVSKLFTQDDRQNEDLPFGSRGGLAIRHNFPADGEYVIQIRLQRNNDGFIRGMHEAHPLDVRLEGARIKLFTVGGERKGRTGPLFTRNYRDYRGDPEQLEYELRGDSALEVRFPAKAGTRPVAVAFLNKTTQPEGMLQGQIPLLADFGRYRGGEPAVESVTIIGPYNSTGVGETASRRKIFVCYPNGPQEEPSCARRILASLSRRAYRRPATDAELEDLLDVYETGRKESGGFEGGIETTLQRILAGPEFLFRFEHDPDGVAPNTAYRLSDLELASRLSFFLWSSIPDDELLDLAERGQLRNREVLEQQVRRMLADPRSKALGENFAGQWLGVRDLRATSVADPQVFPEFDGELREAFQNETELFFASMLREDRPVMDLLNADYTFVNERLARHYGIPDVYGSSFRRVTLAEEARKGLLGQGTILTATSRANRTSPVLRGKWVLDNLLGVPPPPPPPNVMAGLKEKSDDGKVLTVRQQIEGHRANPACAACHSLMDPIGFSLDNFNGIGQWRTMDAGAPLDVSGMLYDGTRFQGPVELRKLLMDRQELVVHTVTEKLFTYALGRGIESYDQPAVRQILRESAPRNYRWSSLILGIVNSTPFQMRRSREP